MSHRVRAAVRFDDVPSGGRCEASYATNQTHVGQGAAALIVEANQQLSAWLEPRPQDLPGLLGFAGKDGFGAEETECDNVEFANAFPRMREWRLCT